MHHPLCFDQSLLRKLRRVFGLAAVCTALLLGCKTSPASGPPATGPGPENQSATPTAPDPGPPPEENRLVKTVLAGDLNEPMELAVAPDGRVFFVERAGKATAVRQQLLDLVQVRR